MFAHKEISHKVHGPTRSENARHLSVWVYRERCEHLIHSVCADFAPRKLLFVRHYTICVLISQNVAHHQTKEVTHAWWGLDCDLRPNEKKNKPEFRLWRLPWKARVINSCGPKVAPKKWNLRKQDELAHYMSDKTYWDPVHKVKAVIEKSSEIKRCPWLILTNSEKAICLNFAS